MNTEQAVTTRSLPWQPDSAELMRRLARLPHPVFFDSGMNSDRGARYDILTACPTSLFTLADGKLMRLDLDWEAHEAIARPEAGPPPGLERQALPVRTTTLGDADIFAAIKSALAVVSTQMPGPFTGGAAGYIGYDALPPPLTATADGRREQARGHEYPHTSAAQVGIYHWSLVVDHQLKTSTLRFLPSCPAAIRQRVMAALDDSARAGRFRLRSDFTANLSRAAYTEAFDQLKAYIEAGDCYQANLAQRFEACFEGDPLVAYLALRARSRSPFSAYMGLPDGAILSLSPERFVQVREGKALTQPIKGTRRRGATTEEDEALRNALLASEKDRAENLMIVDLLRNDLGSLCETGTVRTEKLFELQSFNSVHHLVSTISGRLAPAHSPLDLLRNCFPGGSITGAPKIRAMQIIRELEPNGRAIYCGSMLYVGFDGQMDSNIAIRTLLCERGRIYCWGGGGIVADSECEQEYQESCDKVALLLDTLRSVSRGPAGSDQSAS